MALFTDNDIAEMKEIRNSKRSEEFALYYAQHISDEMKVTVSMLYDNNDLFVAEVKNRMSARGIAEVEIFTIHSFDFSKVDDKEKYISKAYEAYPQSFTTSNNVRINRFNLWKSKNFLHRLAELVYLPYIMSFVVRSYKITDDDNKLFKKANIDEYIVDLCLRVRLK